MSEFEFGIHVSNSKIHVTDVEGDCCGICGDPVDESWYCGGCQDITAPAAQATINVTTEYPERNVEINIEAHESVKFRINGYLHQRGADTKEDRDV